MFWRTPQGQEGRRWLVFRGGMDWGLGAGLDRTSELHAAVTSVPDSAETQGTQGPLLSPHPGKGCSLQGCAVTLSQTRPSAGPSSGECPAPLTLYEREPGGWQ